ncbi:MAG: sugar phosphate isomerase/epimerase family protein [Spirochaetaceae bacterium]
MGEIGAAARKRLCVHTVTTKPWDVERAIDEYARAGVAGITVWRDAFETLSPAEVGRRTRDAGLTPVSLCRGGFFAHHEERERRRALSVNRQAVAETAEVGAPVLVLVCGADPEQPLADSRAQIEVALSELAPVAREHGVRLAVEPLHPMYADTRSAINTLGDANDVCERVGDPAVGVAVDVYHLWWDPHLETQIQRSGRLGRLFAYHVCDWRVPTEDLLTDRGLMGEGCIPLRRIRDWVERAGFTGFCEVEIFSTRYWAMDQGEFLRRIVSAYDGYV